MAFNAAVEADRVVEFIRDYMERMALMPQLLSGFLAARIAQQSPQPASQRSAVTAFWE